MSNMSKDFKRKAKARKCADGGGVGSFLRNRGQDIDAIVDAAVEPTPPPSLKKGTIQLPKKPVSSSPPPSPPPPSPAPKAGLRRMADGGPGFRDYLGEEYNDNVYQQNALRDGGRIKGKGGRTDDKIGPVMLSNDEYVLPADTADVIGREELDLLRLRTHDFKDGKKESRLRNKLRGMVDGGSVYDRYMNMPTPERLAAAQKNYQNAQARIIPPEQKMPGYKEAMRAQSEALRSRTQQALSNRTPPASPPPSTPSTPSSPRGGVPRGAPPSWWKTFSKLAGGVGAAAAGLGTAYNATTDEGQKTREQREALHDVNSPWKSFAVDSMYAGADFFDNLLGGVPGRVGQGLASLYDGQGFMSGFSGSPSPEEKASETIKPDVAPSNGLGTPDPDSYQSRKLLELGVPYEVQQQKPMSDALRRYTMAQGGTSDYVNLGNFGGSHDIYGRATDPTRPGKINEYVGVGANPPEQAASSDMANSWKPPSQAEIQSLRDREHEDRMLMARDRFSKRQYDINSRYEEELKALNAISSSMGAGSLAKARAALSVQRDRALEENERNLITMETGVMSDANTRESNQIAREANTQALSAAGLRERNKAFEEQQKALLDEQKRITDNERMSRDRAEKGYGRYDSYINNMFVGPDNKLDKQRQERFRQFVSAMDLEGGMDPLSERLAEMGPQDQVRTMEDMRMMFEVMERANDYASRWGQVPGVQSKRRSKVFDPSTIDIRSSKGDDFWNKNLGLGSLVWDTLPGTDDRVLEVNGVAVPLERIISPDGVLDENMYAFLERLSNTNKESRENRTRKQMNEEDRKHNLRNKG